MKRRKEFTINASMVVVKANQSCITHSMSACLLSVNHFRVRVLQALLEADLVP